MRACVGPLYFGLEFQNEQPCELPALRDSDMCLYHAARELVTQLAPEFTITVSEPEPVSVRAAHEPEVSL